MGLFDTFMSDTVGLVWRASTGSVDPWTKQEIIDQGVAADIQAGADPDQARQEQTQVVTDTLKTFSLGGGDPVGADPSQAKLSLPSLQAIKDALGSLTKDNGSGCGLTNLGGCVQIPSWVWWVGGGLAALLILNTLGPYVGLLKRRD